MSDKHIKQRKKYPSTYEYRERRGDCIGCGKRKPVVGKKYCEKCLIINRKKYHKKKAVARKTGKCVICKNKAVTGLLLCEACRKSNKENTKNRIKDLKKAGICVRCRSVVVSAGRTLCDDCSEKSRKDHLLMKMAVINGYGGKCSCCGEKEPCFLSLDHINGKGNQHRKSLGSATKLYRIVIKLGFPKEYQILCHNCNHGKHINGGVCPHKVPK